MTKLRHWLLVFEEVANDFLTIRIIANIFRCTTAWDHERGIIASIHVCKSKVRIPAVAGLFCVGVVTLFKIMYHESQFFLARRSNMDLVPLLFEPLIGIHHLKRLSSIAGQN